MKKLTIKSIVDFKNRSDRSKQNFVTALKLDKQKSNTSKGGDYWKICVSAISNAFKLYDIEFINDKIIEFEEKLKITKIKITQLMYKRNIDILYGYKDFNLKKWRPEKKLLFETKHKERLVLNIKGLEIQADASFVFKFQKDQIEEIGAVWFIANKDGYKKDELGMFVDVLYRYLKANYSKECKVNTKYCIAIDVSSKTEINYSQLETGEVPMKLSSLLDEINKLM